jgi:hypothetical protein
VLSDPKNQWAEGIIDSATPDKIENHFMTIKQKEMIGKPATLTKVLQGPATPLAKSTGKRKKAKKDGRRSLLKPVYLLLVLHPFVAHLKDWEQGVPVDCGAPWSMEAIEIAVARGAHPAARTPNAIELVHKDVEYQVKAVFLEVMLWDDIKHNLPPNFKVSPAKSFLLSARSSKT